MSALTLIAIAFYWLNDTWKNFNLRRNNPPETLEKVAEKLEMLEQAPRLAFAAPGDPPAGEGMLKDLIPLVFLFTLPAPRRPAAQAARRAPRSLSLGSLGR